MTENININLGVITLNLIFKNSYYCNLRKNNYNTYNVFFKEKLIIEEFEIYQEIINFLNEEFYLILVKNKLKESEKIKSIITKEINKQFK